MTTKHSNRRQGAAMSRPTPRVKIAQSRTHCQSLRTRKPPNQADSSSAETNTKKRKPITTLDWTETLSKLLTCEQDNNQRHEINHCSPLKLNHQSSSPSNSRHANFKKPQEGANPTWYTLERTKNTYPIRRFRFQKAQRPSNLGK